MFPPGTIYADLDCSIPWYHITLRWFTRLLYSKQYSLPSGKPPSQYQKRRQGRRVARRQAGPCYLRKHTHVLQHAWTRISERDGELRLSRCNRTTGAWRERDPRRNAQRWGMHTPRCWRSPKNTPRLSSYKPSKRCPKPVETP